jgi:very-short-patch-repair endonuclease
MKDLKDMTPAQRLRREKRDYLRRLRKNTSPAHAILWSKLRRHQMGCNARRTKEVQNYPVDFYLPRHKLIIMVNMPTRDEKQDKVQDAVLKAKGYKTLRVEYQQVIDDIEAVMTAIRSTIMPR